MKLLAKNLIAAAISGTLFIAGAVAYADEPIVQKIEIKAEHGEDVVLKVNSEGEITMLELTGDEMEDKDLLESKLAGLDDKTRETVMAALDGISLDASHIKILHGDESNFDEEHKQIMLLHKGDGNIVKHSFNQEKILEWVESATDMDFAGKAFKQHIIIADSDGNNLSGKVGLIEKLINKGDFTQDDLDKLQAALDSKR